MGCIGQLDVAYAGPKAFMPADLDRAHEGCTCFASQASCGAGGSRNSALTRLCEMGFDEESARQALVAADASGVGSSDRVEAACDHLMGAMPSQAAAAQPGSPEVEACMCAICTEDLEPANAAMRCTGQHGKRHYYHAHCLSQWIQQCRRDNLPPTCPECRGELQVRARRLHDFLTDNSGKLNRDDMEALRAVHDAASSESDVDGWSGIKKETLLKGLAVGAGVAIAGVALAAALGAFTSKREDRDRR